MDDANETGSSDVASSPSAVIDAARQPSISMSPDGTRTVSWTVTDATGQTLVFQHQLPDAIRHHYRAAGIGQDVLLYEGDFRIANDSGDSYSGWVRWRWADRPRVEACGTRPATQDALQSFLSSASNPSLWVSHDELLVDLLDGKLPPQPTTASPIEDIGEMIRPRVEQQLGDGSTLEHVTFFVANGWESLDGHQICDPNDLMRHWNGRVSATADGWTVTIDPTGDTDWRALKDSGSYCFTHVGQLSRSDGSYFSGEEAFHALDRIRVALNLALGRRTTCALPVGWRQGRPIWGRWRSAPVDAYRVIRHWVDDSIAASQVTAIIECVLKFSATPAAWEVLRPAAAYYVAANMDVDVELSVSIPISALQLLSYYRFVSDRKSYSNGKWKKLDTEEQLRLLLCDIHADLTVQPHFQHLIAVQTRLAQNAPLRDALGVVVKMRNIVTHPSKDKPARFSVYEWAEAGMHGRYWLCLALLNLVGYSGQVLATMGPQPPWTGQTRLPPWGGVP